MTGIGPPPNRPLLCQGGSEGSRGTTLTMRPGRATARLTALSLLGSGYIVAPCVRELGYDEPRRADLLPGERKSAYARGNSQARHATSMAAMEKATAAIPAAIKVLLAIRFTSTSDAVSRCLSSSARRAVQLTASSIMGCVKPPVLSRILTRVKPISSKRRSFSSTVGIANPRSRWRIDLWRRHSRKLAHHEFEIAFDQSEVGSRLIGRAQL